MLFQNWLKSWIFDSSQRSSVRERWKTQSFIGRVALTQQGFQYTPIVEMLEARILLSVDPVVVADLVIGAGGSNPSDFVNVNGTLFFRANDGVNGIELWRSNGKAAGTTLVKDILKGSGGSSPSFLMNVNGTLFFSANDGVAGHELWRSDGTSAGTTLVKDLVSGNSNSLPLSLANVNGTLYFSALSNATGAELWKSDGTAAGTILVKDIRSGSGGSQPRYLTNVNGTLFFSAEDVRGRELWRSDGTQAGTTLVRDIRIFQDFSSSPTFLTNVNGTLFFRANDGTSGAELWRSDGTPAGTTLVKDIRTGVDQSGGPRPSDPELFTNVNGTLFFSAFDDVNGRELWQSDGTSAGTTLIKDIRSGGDNSIPRSLTNVNGTLFFSSSTNFNGVELWKSDGTLAGTTLVKDIHGGSVSSNPRYLTNVNGTLFFRAVDDKTGYELWKSDGTSAGTTLVKDIHSGGGSYPGSLTTVNGTLFFSANDGGHGRELWSMPVQNRIGLVGTSGTDAFVLTYSSTLTKGNVTVTVSTNGGAVLNLGTFPMNSSLTIDGRGGADSVRIVGTAGADTITVNSPSLTVNGASLILSSIENRTLVGAAGSDIYKFDADSVLGHFTLDEASGGTDTIDLAFTTTVGLSLNLGIASTQVVHPTNLSLNLRSASTFENVTGGSGNDLLTGNGLTNVLGGGNGNDTMNGAGGNDTLVGGNGNDTYIFTTAKAFEADTVTETAGAGIDTISFSAITTPVTLSLGTGAVQAAHTNRTVRLNSTTQFENVAGGSSNDRLTGNSVANTLIGNGGNDTLLGSGGRDVLIGGLGQDALSGGDGEDILIAGGTTSDAFFSNLNRIQLEWAANNSYGRRIKNLRAGVGSPAVSLKIKVNVRNDAGEDDSLIGGNNMDWYFRALDDVITGLVPGEILDVL